MTTNDLFLLLTWIVGIGGAVVSMASARKRVRAAAQLELDKASFLAAEGIIGLLRHQIEEMREELKVVRGEMNALRAREGKLLGRIQSLEFILKQNNLTVPPFNGTEI